MVSCAIRSCTSRSNVVKKSSGITYHRFPKDPVFRNAWIHFVNRGAWQPTKYSVLCSNHFAECYVDRTSQGNVRLRDNAVPSSNTAQNNEKQDDYNLVNDVLMEHNYTNISVIKIEPKIDVREDNNIPLNTHSMTCSTPNEAKVKNENDIEVWTTDEQPFSESDMINEEIYIKQEVEAHDNRKNQTPPKKRGLWSENSLKEALVSIQNGMSVLKASEVYAIPRRPLRDHIKLGSSIKRLRKCSALNSDDNADATAFSMTCSTPDEAKVKNENDIEAWKTDEQAFSECDIKNEEIYIKQEEVEAHDNSMTCSDPDEARVKIENDIEVWKSDELTFSECDVKIEEIDVKHEEVEAHDNSDLVNCFGKATSDKGNQKSQYQNAKNHEHLFEHKNITFRCDKCDYETILKSGFDLHQLQHKNFRELMEHNECGYQRVHKRRLETRIFRHPGLPNTFKCDKCDYTTNLKNGFGLHQLQHKNSKESMKCHECGYQTVHKRVFETHILGDCAQATFKCYKCDYQTVHKHLFEAHILQHPKFNCDKCDYKTILKSGFDLHQLQHKYF